MKLFERKQVFSRSGSTPLKNYSRDKKKIMAMIAN